MSDQAESLRLKLQRKYKSEAKVLAIVSGKGGVGKSNFSLNFSINLAKRGHSVLLFDMDIGMGNIDILLGHTSKGTFIDIFKPAVLIKDIIKKGPHGIHYIAGGSGLSTLFQLDGEKITFLLNQLELLSLQYEYIIFDMGAGIKEDILQLLLSVHEIFVITTPEPTSMTDAYSMMKYICTREQTADIYLVVNRAQGENEGMHILSRLSQVMKQFLQKEIIELGYLPEDRAVNKSVIRQSPFSISDPKSKISVALSEVTDRYITGTGIKKQQEKRSFISKLRQYFSVK